MLPSILFSATRLEVNDRATINDDVAKDNKKFLNLAAIRFGSTQRSLYQTVLVPTVRRRGVDTFMKNDTIDQFLVK